MIAIDLKTYENNIKLNEKSITYSNPDLEDLKNKLYKTKSQLDDYFNKYMFSVYWKQFDPFRTEKEIISKIANTKGVTNAWIKCYELLIYFDLLPYENNDNFLHFDNASFPGTFILCTHHLITTTKNWINKYNWKASSLISSNDLAKNPLEDNYGLYKKYPNNWLMDSKYNGDVLSKYNQENFYSKLGGKVDLYTSDLGFDVSSDYNKQEILHMSANLGQILSGILTLKKGGHFIIKQYSMFENTNISIMYLLSELFDEFYVCKPYTSREANSETYLVGKNFKSKITIKHKYFDAIIRRIDKNHKNKIDIEIPLFDINKLPKKFINKIVHASEIIFNKQIDKINSDIKNCLEAIELNFKGSPRDNPIVKKFKENINNDIEKWYLLNTILPIENSDIL